MRAPLQGTAPGVVEGRVCVVLSPSQHELRAGDILVCTATDPAWSPLFLLAAGVVTELGGTMTHSAICSRELGLAAVTGVSCATQRLRTGMQVRLNGTTGRIEVLEEHAEAE